MNTQLIDYGIQTEQSDYRIHLCVKVRLAYIFPTKDAVRVINNKKYRIGKARTEGITTGEGYLVPPDDIPNMQIIELKKERFDDFDFEWSTSVKGNFAVEIAKEMLVAGIVKFPFETTEITDKDMQITGTDIIITNKLKIQVKCDYSGGDRKRDGSGNLFLQIKECNPFKQY